MVILSQEDLYQVKFASLIADYDRKTLIDLYMPIVGYTAIAIYFTLWTEAEKNDIASFVDHNHLLVSMQMATGKFVDERKKLEALGLLKTSIKKETGVNFYTYQIYAPKTPERFFNNTLLYGTLIKFIGERNASKLRAYYSTEQNMEYGQDISASFGSIYSPDLTNPIYKVALEIKKGEIIDRLQSKVDAEFNFQRFIDNVKKSSQIGDAVFTKKVLKEMERLAALYGVGEESAADCFIRCYNPSGPRGQKIDWKTLTELFQEEIKFPFLAKNQKIEPARVTSETVLAKKINMMEDASCKEYLQLKQNGTIPVLSDLKLVEDLSSKLGLKPGVINAIIDYTLEKNNNILSRNFVEKIAASVARENITTAYDTMVFLTRRNNRNQGYKNRYNDDPVEEMIDDENSKEENIDDDFDEEEWNKMLEGLGGN